MKYERIARLFTNMINVSYLITSAAVFYVWDVATLEIEAIGVIMRTCMSIAMVSMTVVEGIKIIKKEVQIPVMYTVLLSAIYLIIMGLKVKMEWLILIVFPVIQIITSWILLFYQKISDLKEKGR